MCSNLIYVIIYAVLLCNFDYFICVFFCFYMLSTRGLYIIENLYSSTILR